MSVGSSSRCEEFSFSVLTNGASPFFIILLFPDHVSWLHVTTLVVLCLKLKLANILKGVTSYIFLYFVLSYNFKVLGFLLLVLLCFNLLLYASSLRLIVNCLVIRFGTVSRKILLKTRRNPIGTLRSLTISRDHFVVKVATYFSLLGDDTFLTLVAYR